VVLEVIDNGMGLPANFNWEKTQSLGLKLVALLSREQLRGDVQIKRAKGTHFLIRFETGE